MRPLVPKLAGTEEHDIKAAVGRSIASASVSPDGGSGPYVRLLERGNRDSTR
jgi:hypothetical protein